MVNISSDYLDGVTSSYSPAYDYSEYYNSGVAEEIPCTFGSKSKYFLPVLYSLFFVVGFLGNMLVLWVILRGAKIKSMTDVSLLNLTIADLLLLFTLPFLGHYARYPWVFGDAMCKLVLSAYYIGFYAESFFIVLMSIDRYLAVIFSVCALRIRLKMFGILASMGIWILAIASSLPLLPHLGVVNDLCLINAYSKNGEHNYVRSTTFIRMNILGLLIPLIVVGFCYSVVFRRHQTIASSTKLANLLVFVVTVVFFCCWVPYNIAALFKVLELRGILNSTCSSSKNIHLALQVTEAIAYSHSCINPFLYALWGKSSLQAPASDTL